MQNTSSTAARNWRGPHSKINYLPLDSESAFAMPDAADLDFVLRDLDVRLTELERRMFDPALRWREAVAIEWQASWPGWLVAEIARRLRKRFSL